MRRVRLLAPFRRLRWKLAFSYTAALVAFVVVLSLATMGQLVFVVTVGQTSVWRGDLQETMGDLAAGARRFLSQVNANEAELETWVRAAIPSEDWAVVVDPSGALLVANSSLVADEAGSAQPAVADPLAPTESRRLIDQALAGTPEILGLAGGVVLAAEPIVGDQDQILGALYVRLVRTALLPGTFLGGTLQILGAVTAVFALAAIIVGTLTGLLMASGFVRRLGDLDRATQAWGRGDFSSTVRDKSPDEIGQLTRRMSRMAQQIQDLLRVRQDLATLEERNRLARELHDSVKQDIFAATMTLGTAKSLRETDPVAAWCKVDEALDLSWQAQQELTGLIHELRPSALEARGLAAAVQEYASRWADQTGVEAQTAARGDRPIPPDVEQALFRVAQEALANVAKHSDASRVDIRVVSTRRAVRLEVADDGAGFDPASAEGRGVGLRSMRERIEALDGRFAVESAAGKGTRVVARCRLG